MSNFILIKYNSEELKYRDMLHYTSYHVVYLICEIYTYIVLSNADNYELKSMHVHKNIYRKAKWRNRLCENKIDRAF